VPDQFPERSGMTGADGVVAAGEMAVAVGVAGVAVGVGVVQPAASTIQAIRIISGIHFIVKNHSSMNPEKDGGVRSERWGC